MASTRLAALDPYGSTTKAHLAIDANSLPRHAPTFTSLGHWERAVPESSVLPLLLAFALLATRLRSSLGRTPRA